LLPLARFSGAAEVNMVKATVATASEALMINVEELYEISFE
jgi:hypothetical protein